MAVKITVEELGFKASSLTPESMLLCVVTILPSSLEPLKPELVGYFKKNESSLDVPHARNQEPNTKNCNKE